MGRSWAGCCRLPASVYRRRRETRRVEEGVAVLARMRAWRNGSGAEEVVRGAWDVGVCWARSYGVGLMRCGSPRYGYVLFFSCSPPRRWLLRVAAPAPASVASCRRRLPRQGIEKGRRHPTRRGHAWPHREERTSWWGRRPPRSASVRSWQCQGAAPDSPPPSPPLRRQCTSTAPPPTSSSKRCPPHSSRSPPCVHTPTPPTVRRAARPPPDPAHTHNTASRGSPARPAIPSGAAATAAAPLAASRQPRLAARGRRRRRGYGRHPQGPTCHPRWRRRSGRRPRPS